MMLHLKNSDVWTADCRTIRNHTKTSEEMSGLNSHEYLAEIFAWVYLQYWSRERGGVSGVGEV
jgi:hypothetical protein